MLLFGYSYTKRFTWLCHLFLGLAIAAGPGGAWIAVTGGVSAPALWLMLAVATWIGGFDILYALADRDFDRTSGLQSIPARFGVRGALALSAGLHAVTVAALLRAGPVRQPGGDLPGRDRGHHRDPALGARHLAPLGSAPARHGVFHSERVCLDGVPHRHRRAISCSEQAPDQP